MNNISVIGIICVAGFSTVFCDYNDKFIKAFLKHRPNARIVTNNLKYVQNIDVFPKVVVNAKLKIGIKKSSITDYFLLNFLDLNNTFKNIYFFNSFMNYIVFVEEKDFPYLCSLVDRYELSIEVFVLIVIQHEDYITLYEVYKIQRIGPIELAHYGNWTLKNGLFEPFLNKALSSRRRNLKYINLTAGISLSDQVSLKHLDELTHPAVDFLAKQDYEPMMCVFALLNINYSLKVVDSYSDLNIGNFSELLKDIQEESTDVTISSTSYPLDKPEGLDFLFQGNPHDIGFLLMKPQTSFIKSLFYITFDVSVWIASLVVLLLFALIEIAVLNWEVKYKKQLKQNKYNLSDTSLIALETLCQQGTTTDPQSYAGRVLTFILLAAFMFIYVSYSANIVVLLQSTTAINDVSELFKSRFEIGSWNRNYMSTFYERLRDDALKQLYERKNYINQYYPIKEGISKMQEGRFAYQVSLAEAYKYILRHFTNYEICGMQQFSGEAERNRGYVAIKSSSTYKELIKIQLLKVNEYGLRERTRLKVIINPECFIQSATFKNIGLYDCEEVIWIFILGIPSSFIVFVIEIMIKCAIKNRRCVFRHT